MKRWGGEVYLLIWRGEVGGEMEGDVSKSESDGSESVYCSWLSSCCWVSTDSCCRSASASCSDSEAELASTRLTIPFRFLMLLLTPNPNGEYSSTSCCCCKVVVLLARFRACGAYSSSPPSLSDVVEIIDALRLALLVVMVVVLLLLCRDEDEDDGVDDCFNADDFCLMLGRVFVYVFMLRDFDGCFLVEGPPFLGEGPPWMVSWRVRS